MTLNRVTAIILRRVVEDTPYCLRQICSPKTTFRQGIINGDILRDD